MTTLAGAEVTADIWFRCYGVAPASDFLAGGLAAARHPDGFVEVTPELRVAGQRHGSDDLVPAEVVSQLKGRDMMVDRFAELLGVRKAAPGEPGAHAKAVKRHRSRPS